MPRNRILAHRQSFQEHRYPSDLFIEEHYEPHEVPALSSERIQQSTKKPKTKKRNLIARLALHRRSSKRKMIPEQLIAGAEYNKTDYRERWPTVTTLVTQSDPRYLEDIDEEFEEERHARRRSTKAKALEAVATPLDWLTDRLGSVSEHLGRQIKVADGRGQGKAVSTSTRRSTAKPGRSTHPYDTGVVTLAEATPKECPTAPARTQITEDTGMTKRGDLLRAKESLIIPTKQRLRQLSDRSATSGRAHQKRLLEHGQAIANSANQRSATQGRHYLQLSSEAVEGPMLLEERKKWQRHFLESAGKRELQGGTTNPKPKSEQGRMRSSTDDVTIIPKPREDWKPVQRRQASRYPEGVYEQDRYLVHKKDFVTQSQGTDRQSSMTHPKHEQSRFKAVRRASSNNEMLQDAHSGVNKHFLRPPHPPSTSDSPASALLRPRSKLSGEHPEIRTTGTTPTSARQGSSAIHDITPIEYNFAHRPQTPKAGFLGHWLGMLSNKAPPSRAVTPGEDLEEVTLIIPTEEVIAARRQCPSNVTTASRGSKRSHQTEHTFSSDHPISFEGDPHRPALGQRGSWFSSRRKSSPSFGKSQKKTLTQAKNDSIMSRRTSREKTAKGKSSDISQAGSGGP